MAEDELLRRLLNSHAELRAALIMAGKQIRRLNFGKSDNKMLVLLRRTLRESRVVSSQFEKSNP